MNIPRLLSLFLGLLLAVAAQAAAPAAPDPLDSIAAYAGTWKTDIEHLLTPYSNAIIDHSTLENRCWRSNQFYACNQVVDGKSVALLVFTYIASKGYYVSHAVPDDGSDGHTGKLYIHDNVWTFPWEYNDKGKLIYFRVVNTFTRPGEIDYREEYSEDRKAWVLMGLGHEVKLH